MHTQQIEAGSSAGICDSCETVSHCSRKGCIPLTPLEQYPARAAGLPGATQPTARLIAALRMVLPLVDSDGQAWQSDEIRAAIADGEAEQQALAGDRALNAVKASPAYFAPSDLFSLSQQNRGAV
jgi:hypothetical protein